MAAHHSTATCSIAGEAELRYANRRRSKTTRHPRVRMVPLPGNQQSFRMLTTKSSPSCMPLVGRRAWGKMHRRPSTPLPSKAACQYGDAICSQHAREGAPSTTEPADHPLPARPAGARPEPGLARLHPLQAGSRDRDRGRPRSSCPRSLGWGCPAHARGRRLDGRAESSPRAAKARSGRRGDRASVPASDSRYAPRWHHRRPQRRPRGPAPGSRGRARLGRGHPRVLQPPHGSPGLDRGPPGAPRPSADRARGRGRVSLVGHTHGGLLSPGAAAVFDPLRDRDPRGHRVHPGHHLGQSGALVDHHPQFGPRAQLPRGRRRRPRRPRSPDRAALQPTGRRRGDHGGPAPPRPRQVARPRTHPRFALG